MPALLVDVYHKDGCDVRSVLLQLNRRKGVIGSGTCSAWQAAGSQADVGQATRMQDDIVWSVFFFGLAAARNCLFACFSILQMPRRFVQSSRVAPCGPGSRETEVIRVSAEPGRETSFAPAQPRFEGERSYQTAKCQMLHTWRYTQPIMP